MVGRKNFLFHNSVDGAKASAIIYSIVLTAKANNLDIRKYVEILLQRMPDYKNEPDGIRKTAAMVTGNAGGAGDLPFTLSVNG